MTKCLIVINTKKQESHILAKEIAFFLKEKNVDSSFYSFDGFSSENPFKGYDFVITLGGDGTVLFAARGCVEYDIPVFPVNLGEFGFISSIQKNEWKAKLELFLQKKLYVAERSLLKAAVTFSQNQSSFTGTGLNDVVICAKTAARTISFDVYYNQCCLGRFKSDGIIVSTATGSTAYSASAGGPIIDAELDALVLTPVNSFSLSSRPLVLSPKGEIGIKILPSRQNDVIITLDGQEPQEIHEGDLIKIRLLQKKIKLAGSTSERFYEALRSKLNWSGGPHA